jgi:selenocysteine lyase/cysteine desulfurase
MQQAAPNSLHSGESLPAAEPAFASLLSALARSKQESLPPWDDGDLAEDVATLSYERALQASAPYRPRDLDDRSLTQPTSAASGKATAASSLRGQNGDPAPSQLKSASITIRMSHAECEQLRRRASEAGLTVSAYLRSCTFEVEKLRAQVKDTLAQLRPAAQSESAVEAASARSSWIRRMMGR